MKKELTNEEIQNFIEAFNKDKEQAIKMIYDKGIAEGFISKLEETVKDNIEALYHITAYITLLWDKLAYGSNISLKVTCEGDKKLFYGMYKAGAEYNDSDYDFFNFHQGYAAAYKKLYKMPFDKVLERIGKINSDLIDNNLSPVEHKKYCGHCGRAYDPADSDAELKGIFCCKACEYGY